MAILSIFKKLSPRRLTTTKSLKHTILLVLEVVAGLVVCLILAFGFLTWRLSEGPVSLGFLHAYLQNTINAELSGARAEFATPVMMQEKNGGIRFRLPDIKLRGAGGEVLAAAPLAAISMSPWGLISGKIAVTRMILIRPIITLRRKADGNFSFGIVNSLKETAPAISPVPVKPDEVKKEKTRWTALFSEGQFNLLDKLKIDPDSKLAHIGVREAKLILIDESRGLLLNASNTRLALNRTKTGYTLFASTQFDISGGLSSLSFTAMVTNGRDVKIFSRFRDITPSEFAPLLALSAFGGAELPISGRASLVLNAKGHLKSASAEIESGAGLLHGYGGSEASLLIDEARADLRFDGLTDRLKIKSATLLSGQNQIRFSGEVALQRDQNHEITSYDLNLNSNDMALLLDGESSKPAKFTKATVKARISLNPLEIILEKAELRAKKLQVEISGRLRDAPDSPEIHLQGKGKRIPVNVIKRLWPTTLAPGTRAWIGNNIKAGYINKAQFKITLPPGEIARARTGTPIPNQHVQLKFDARNLKFSYMPGLPLVNKASGHGLLEGDRLKVTVTKGHVKVPSGERIALSKVSFSIPAIHEDVTLGKTNGHIHMVLAGKTSRILELLDMKPLGYVSMLKINPRKVGGTARGSVDLVIPLVRETSLNDISIKAIANLKGATIKDVYKGVDLGNGDIKIKVNKKGLEAKGKITLNTVPLSLKWKERFTPGKKLSTRFELAGTLDDKARKALDLDFTDIMNGPAKVKLVALAKRGAIKTAHVEADLASARLKQDDIKWLKPEKIPATAVFDLEFLKEGRVRLHNLVLKGKNLKLTGAIRFDEGGNILKLDMGHIQLGRFSQFSLSGIRLKNNILSLKAKGKRFDARPLLRDFMSSSSPQIARTSSENPSKTTLSANFAEVLMLNNVKLKKANVDLLSVDDLTKRFSLKGLLGKAQPIIMRISARDAHTRRLLISSNDAGALLRGTDFYTRIKGGVFHLDAIMKNPANTMSGTILIKKFNIVGEPALKSIMNSSELKGKKGRAGNGEDVPFNKLKVDFGWVPGVLTIKQSLIAGPSIGATVRGKLNRVTKTLKLAGTLVPAYGLNAFFGKIPLLGPFLSGRKGEGLIGLTFGIEGPINGPVIAINPASALAPGFLRLLFEFNSGIKSKPPKFPDNQNDR